MHYFACGLSVSFLKRFKFAQFMRCKNVHNQNSESDNTSDNSDNNFHKKSFLQISYKIMPQCLIFKLQNAEKSVKSHLTI